MESLISEIRVDGKTTQTLNYVLEGLKETLGEIELKLKEIGERTTYNASLWFFIYYRSYGFDDIIKEIELLKIILDGRKKELFEIIKINQFLVNVKQDSKDEWLTLALPLAMCQHIS